MYKKELRKQTNIDLREYPSRETIPLPVDREEGILTSPPPLAYCTVVKNLPTVGFLAVLLHTGVVLATALPVAYTSKCVLTLQYMNEEAGIITESPRKSPAAEFLDETQTKVLRVSFILFTVTSAALLRDFYFFKLTQPLTVLKYSVHCKGERREMEKIIPPRPPMV